MESSLSPEEPILSPVELFIKRHEASLLRYIKYVQEYSSTANRKVSPEILHREIIRALKADSDAYMEAHKSKIPYLDSMLDGEEEIKESEEEKWMNGHIRQVFEKYRIKFLDVNELEQLVEDVAKRATPLEEGVEVRTPFNGDVEMKVELTPDVISLRKLAEQKPYILNLITRPIIRKTIDLYVIQGKSLGDLAIEMKLSPNTIKGYIATALNSMKVLLAQGAIMPAPLVQEPPPQEVGRVVVEAPPLVEEEPEDRYLPFPELSKLSMGEYMSAIKRLRNAGIPIKIVNNGNARTDYIAAEHFDVAKRILAEGLHRI